MPESIPIRLSAFVGRSFLEDDKKVWHDLRDILESMRRIGLVFEDAKESQLRSISEKVKERIPRNDIYIGVLTRRHPIPDLTPTFWNRCRSVFDAPTPKRWTTSAWVIEEIGFAIGKDRRTIVLIEEGVDFPPSDLDADTQWISFKRENLAASQSELNSMINDLIGKDFPASASGGTATDAPPKQEAEVLPSTETFQELFTKLKAAVSAGESAEADRIQEELLKSETDPVARIRFSNFLLYDRASRGDRLALDKLKALLEQNLGDLNALGWLARVYSHFSEHHKAEQLFVRSAPHIDPTCQADFTAAHAKALRSDGKAADAIRILRESFRVSTSDDDRLVIWKALASAAEDTKDQDLEISFLEKVMELEPTNHDLRFRLAWLYGETNRDELSAFHYRILQRTQGEDTAIGNNLAVAYKAMGLTASQVEEYLKVTEKHDLAKANLAQIYATAGFLEIAESYAKSVLQSTKDSNANSRARGVLEDVAATRAKEDQAIQNIGENSRNERQFLSDFANGYSDQPLPTFSAPYKVRGDKIKISVKGNEITGSSSEIREWNGGLLGLFSLNAIGTPPHKRLHVATLTGTITSRAGTFELTTEVFNPPESTKPESTSTTNGLFIIEPDLQSIKLLERSEKRTRIVIANRVPETIT